MGKKKNKPEVQKQVNGRKMLLVNKSNEEYYCASTGVKLPRKGMVVEYNGKFYANWAASARA